MVSSLHKKVPLDVGLYDRMWGSNPRADLCGLVSIGIVAVGGIERVGIKSWGIASMLVVR
jgi:hypothetical protein